MSTLAQAPDSATPTPQGLPAARSRKPHVEMLTMSVVAIALSALLQIRDDGRVFVPGFHQYPLPPSCVSQTALGVKCPGCGLTRSFIHLAHGRWQESWSLHRLGWLIFLAAAAQVPYRLLRIYQPQRTRRLVYAGRWFAWTLLALLLVNWCLDMFVFNQRVA